MENELLRFAEFIDSEPSLAIASPRLKVKMYLQKIASDGDLADVSASALKDDEFDFYVESTVDA